MASYQPAKQNYYASPAPPQIAKSTNNMVDNKGQFEYVAAGPRYHDLWATILFLAHFVSFVVLSGLGIDFLRKRMDQKQQDSEPSSNEPAPLPEAVGNQLLAIILFCSFAGILFSFGYFLLMQRAPRFMVKASLIFSIALYFVVGALMLIAGAWFGALLIFFGFLHVFFYYSWRPFFPLAATTLETVCGITRKYPSTLVITFLSLVVQAAYSSWWATSLVGVAGRFSSGAINAYMVFCLYWTSQVLANTLHVTICGLVGAFYFLEGTPAMPRNPVLGAAKRAFTSSFGPICFGSLIVALVQFVRFLLYQAARQHDLLRAIVDCIMGCIESLVAYFTSFAFVHVAVYGKPFCEAAKDTGRMLKGSGFDIVWGDLLVRKVLTAGSMSVSFATGALAYTAGYVLLHKEPTFAAEVHGLVVMVALLCFLVALVTMAVVTRVIESGIQTTLVCLVEDPAALLRSKPALYNAFKEAYPQIQWRV